MVMSDELKAERQAINTRLHEILEGADLYRDTPSVLAKTTVVLVTAIAELRLRVAALEKPTVRIEQSFTGPSLDRLLRDTVDAKVAAKERVDEIEARAGRVLTREEAEKVCRWWGVNDPERMSAKTPDEAIADYLDQRDNPDPRGWPADETLHLSGYVPMVPTVPVHLTLLDTLLEALDEEFGDDDGDGTKATPAMEAAEQAFITAVLAEYEPFMCEDVYHETVNVREWVKAHRPDWLEEG